MVFENLLGVLLELISEHGVLAVMLGAVLEEIIVPIPSPAMPMAAGATELIVSSDNFSRAALQVFFLVSIPASIASVVSSYFVYGLSYRGGRPLLDKYGRWIDVSLQDVESLEEELGEENQKYYIGLLRALPVVPLSLVSGYAGLLRMDWKTYGLWSFLGMIPRTFFLGMLGWWAKDRFMALASGIDSVSTAVLLFLMGIIAGVIVYRKTQDAYRYVIKYI